MAVAVSSVLLISSFDLVEAADQMKFKLNKQRANRLTKSHQMKLRRNNELHDGPLGLNKKMVYPQSWSHKISNWFGLYGVVHNSAASNE